MALPGLLIFDLDGTLIDSSLDLCNSVNAALRHVQRHELPNSLIASYIGDGAATLMRRALEDCSVDPNSAANSEELFRRAYEYFLVWYRDHKLDNTHCYAGVIYTLDHIRARHPMLPMAVLTNKPVNPSREICSALGLERFFFQNYGGNSFDTKKPDPAGMLRLIAEINSLRSLSLTPADVVMIGDSDVDILTAQRCGARSVGCAYGLAPNALAAAGPDVTVDHPSEWITALGL